jgi:hypothetical protein
VLAVSAVLAFAALAPSAVAVGDRDCSDFSSWNAAQKFFKKNGGPKRDPHGLDADHDGIACEDLR